MSNLTEGRLSATPIRINTSASLQQVLASINQSRPSLTGFVKGWGSIDDPTAPLHGKSKWGGSPIPGNAGLKPAQRSAPTFGAARLYWWVPSKRRAEDLGIQIRDPAAHELCASDVVITDSSVPGRLDGFITVRDEESLAIIRDALASAVSAVDGNSVLELAVGQTRPRDNDFFLWLIWREHHDKALTGRLQLNEIRVVESQDAAYRATSLTEGVDTSRFELLTLISMVRAEFGPIKIKVRDGAHPALYDFELGYDGKFAITLGETHYPTPLGREDKGLFAFLDVAFFVIPELLNAYLGDRDWSASNRRQFIDDCREVLAGPHLTIGLPCVNPVGTGRFYADQLGFVASAPRPDGSVVCSREGIEIIFSPSVSAAGGETLVLTIPDAGDVLLDLRAKGVATTAVGGSARSVDFTVADPDGRTVELRGYAMA